MSQPIHPSRREALASAAFAFALAAQRAAHAQTAPNRASSHPLQLTVPAAVGDGRDNLVADLTPNPINIDYGADR